MKFKEFCEIAVILTKASIDKYYACKIIVLSNSKETNVAHFFEEFFEEIDKRRPKLIEMKGGVKQEAKE